MISDEGVKVVYWLGAGASFRALPIIGEMSAAFRNQHKWVRNAAKDETPADALNWYFEMMHSYAGYAKAYGTIDTYARALYLRGESDELAMLKLHLAMFFMLEQGIQEKNTISGHVVPVSYSKPESIDTRYMSWLALILQGEGRLSDRVRAISWNYDLQVEHALGVYLGLTDLSHLHGKEKVFVYPSPHEETDRTNPFLIHLNGIAGQSHVYDKVDCLYYGLLAVNPVKFIKELFSIYWQWVNGDTAMQHAMMNRFNFSWEKKPIAEQAVAYAKAAMSDAHILVIIGYSFPSFNRAVDKALFQAFNQGDGRRVVIQNPSFTPDMFRSIMGIAGGNPVIQQDDNLDQFHIPPEMF